MATKFSLMDYIISTERLGLRMWRDDDCIPFTQMNKDAVVMKYFPKTLTGIETTAMLNRIKAHFENHGFGLFALEKRTAKEFIGFTGFMVPLFESFFTPCIEIGWRIKKEEWNKGYATEAAKACLQHGFQTLQFSQVYSFTSLLNLKSESVMQKIGMTKCAEFNHPAIAMNNPLCRHVLYKIEKHYYASDT